MKRLQCKTVGDRVYVFDSLSGPVKWTCSVCNRQVTSPNVKSAALAIRAGGCQRCRADKTLNWLIEKGDTTNAEILLDWLVKNYPEDFGENAIERRLEQNS